MWTLDGSTARWRSANLRLRLDVGCPDQGLGEAHWGDRPLPAWRMLRVVALSSGGHRPVLEGAYVRGRDVVASYAQTAHSPVRTEVYWRIRPPSDAQGGAVLETIVSAQTELLDSDPRVEISSVLTGRDWRLLRAPGAPDTCESLPVDARQPCRVPVPPGGAAVLLRASDAGCSYGQVMPGADWVDSRITSDTAGVATTLTTTYFTARLEKGVLRRTGVAALLMPRDHDEALLRAYWSAWQAAAPPLTA